MKVFVAHSITDNQFVVNLTNLLRENGHDVFVPGEMLSSGNILSQISAAIRSADVLVAVITSSNPNILYELGLAAGAGIPTLIIARASEQLPANLASVPYVQLTGDMVRDVQVAFRRAKDLEGLSPRRVTEFKSAEAALRAATRDPSVLESFSPAELERLLAELFKERGYKVESTESTRDAGIDFVLKPRGNRGLVLVQVKKVGRQSRVSVETVRMLSSTVTALSAHLGMIVATSGFTASALALAAETPIVLHSVEGVLAARSEGDLLKHEDLDIVDQTLDDSGRAFELQEKRIEKLEAINLQQQEELAELNEATRLAEAKFKEAEERYKQAVCALDLKEQQVTELEAAKNRVELTGKAEAMTRLYHELLLPVQAIVANAHNLREAEALGLSSEDRAHNAEQVIAQAVRLGLQLQNAILSVSEGEKIYKPTRFSLRDLILEIIALFADEARAKEITLTLRADSPDDFIITGDRSKLRIAIYNVVANAVKYSFSSTQIELRIQSETDRLRVFIENLGIGVAPDEAEHIFKLGYRGTSAKDVSRVGSGMGLYIARQLINAHSGKIELQSSQGTNRGHRTVFEITLPRHLQESLG